MAQIKLFMVDDDLEDQEIFSFTVNNMLPPVSCSFASDGKEALELFKRDATFQPDYIFIDLNMPLMNGFELLKEIKTLNLVPRSKLIIHSTTINKKTESECKLLGANEFIVKCSSYGELRERLQQLLNN